MPDVDDFGGMSGKECHGIPFSKKCEECPNLDCVGHPCNEEINFSEE